ncbi:glucose-6-phosphate exchanger SLC37A4-like [Watersipora subatra]|uniref:glucose-6-phosphate exchanger SLC37A4-like n=1 Tax=Watersipora subatra TaxID=2589382 RepID=UPI00355BCFCA
MSDEEGGSEAEESGTAEETTPAETGSSDSNANLLEPGSDPSIVMLQQVSFTISSFFVGTSLDASSAKTLFALGMFLSGFFNFGFSDADDSGNLMLMASLNGICNGFGWPCVVKVTRAWFPTISFGLWWALMSLSYFLTNLIGPAAANNWANEHGWRVAIQMPAVISMVVASALYFLNIDKPSDVGYQNQKFTQVSSADWGQLYLMEERGLSTYNAGGFGTALECGAIFGTTVIGAMADFAIKKDMHIGYYKFPRMILLFLSLFGGGIVLSSFILGITAYSGAMEVNLYAFVMGLTFCAALQNLEAMLIETAPPNKLNSCYALLGFSNNLAAVTAGFPMSFLASHYGWTRAFLLLNFALLVAFFGLIIGKDLDKSFDPKGSPSV